MWKQWCYVCLALTHRFYYKAIYSKLVGGQSYLEKWFRLNPCWYYHHVKYDALAQINKLVVNLPADPPEQCLEQTVELPVTLDVIMLMGRHSYGKGSGIAQMKRGVVICSGGWMHYNDVIMGPIASQITSFTIVYSIVYSDTDQRKHQSSSSLAFVRGEFSAQMASYAENVYIWWRHHGTRLNRQVIPFPIFISFRRDTNYRQDPNISCTLVGNRSVVHSDVVGASSPVGASSTTSSFSTKHLASMDWAKDNCKTRRETFKLWDLARLILEAWW